MKSQISYSDKISAADKSIGFEYQFYYFLYSLLTIKVGETVGLEDIDDVSKIKPCSKQILVQLKHTTQHNSSNEAKNLTALDIDFWKTIYNWMNIVTDKNDGREQISEQLKFLCKTEFLLVSNKNYSPDNEIVSSIIKYQNSEISYDDLKKIISATKSKNSDLSNYIDFVNAQNDNIKEPFFRNIRFELECDEIIAKCKTAIKEHMISIDKIDEVFNGIGSSLRQDNFVLIKQGCKIKVSFEDFYNKYRIHFDKARNRDFNWKPTSIVVLPEKLSDQTFVKQLIEINEVSEKEPDVLASMSTKLLNTKNLFSELYSSGEITKDEVDMLRNDAKERWEIRFRKAFNPNLPKPLDCNKESRDILYDSYRASLNMAKQDLPLVHVEGLYYDLSDTPEIGWHIDWESKFK